MPGSLIRHFFLYLINHAWNLFCDLIRQEKMAFHFWQHNNEKYNMYITPAVVVYDIFYNDTKSVVDKLFDEKISKILTWSNIQTTHFIFYFWPPLPVDRRWNPDKIPRLPWHFKKISTQLHDFYSKLRSKLKHNILN